MDVPLLYHLNVWKGSLFQVDDGAASAAAHGAVDDHGPACQGKAGALVNMAAEDQRRGQFLYQTGQSFPSGVGLSRDPVERTVGRRMGHQHFGVAGDSNPLADQGLFPKGDSGAKGDGDGAADADDGDAGDFMTPQVERLDVFGGFDEALHPFSVGISSNCQDRQRKPGQFGDSRLRVEEPGHVPGDDEKIRTVGGDLLPDLSNPLRFSVNVCDSVDPHGNVSDGGGGLQVPLNCPIKYYPVWPRQMQ